MKQGEKVKITKQLALQITDQGIQVETVFTPTTPGKFRRVGGQFDKASKIWHLPKTKDAFELLDNLFGIDFEGENPTTKVRVDARYLLADEGFDRSKAAMLGGYVLALRGDPEWSVNLGKGVKKISGGFAGQHPQAHLAPLPDTVLEIEITKRMAERLGLDTPIEERGKGIESFTDDELLAEVERRGLVVRNTTSDVSADNGDEDDDELPF